MASKLFEQNQQAYAYEAFEGGSSTTWDIMYAVAEKYYQSNGSLEPSPKLVTEDGYALGAWLQYLRTQYKKNRKFLTDEQYLMMNAIGMRWDNKYDLKWEASYEELCTYHRNNGHINVPAAYTTDTGLKLGRWIRRQIESYKKGQLRSDRIERLEMFESIKLLFGKIKRDSAWHERFAEAKKYYDSHGDLNVPNGYKDGLGKKLCIWLGKQRECYRDGKLSEDKIRLLRQIGFNLDNADVKHNSKQFTDNTRKQV